MKILDSYHRKARVIGNTIDTGLYHQPTNEDLFYDPLTQYPVHYKAKVQICVLGFIWITVWSATVDFKDEDVEAVNKRASDLADTLSCTGL